MKHALLLLLISIPLLNGYGESSPKILPSGSTSLPVQSGGNGQPSFRVRSEFTAELNSDQGWAGALNENVTIFTDEPFRVRFEVERAPGSAATQQFRLQYRRNTGDWTDVEAHDFPHPEADDAKTPRVSIVSCAAYRNGAATTNLLAGSTAAFQAGAGLTLADHTPAWTFSWRVRVGTRGAPLRRRSRH